MRKYDYILFDLDGTLTDSGEGITKSAQYALSHFGIEEPDLSKLEHFIGPPLGESFQNAYGFDEEKSAEAIKVFRERYNVTGVLENKLYPGIKELLSECKSEGVKLAIASSKPMHLVEKVLKHFDIWKYFDVKVGSIDGVRITKEQVMEETVRQLFGTKQVPTERILMVGDRKYDITGAKRYGFDSLAVSYGYAPVGELEAEKPTYIAGTIMEMRKIMLGHEVSLVQAEVPAMRKSILILKPLFLYWLVNGLVVMLGAFLVGFLAQGSESLAGDMQTFSPQLSVYITAIAALCTVPLLYYYYKESVVQPMSHTIVRKQQKRLLLWALPIVLLASILSIGLNLILAQIPVMQQSQGFEQTANVQYSVSLPIGLLIFGVLMPVVEELMFRGVLYNRIKQSFGTLIAVVLSALIFGLYHGNVVQFVYATILGLVMALLYEKFQMLLAPILFHCSANIVVYIVSKIGG